MSINFNWKNKKQEKEDKYPDQAVITYVETSGTKKFELNKLAFSLLGFSEETKTGNSIAFARLDDRNDIIVLVNVSGSPTEGDNKIPNQSRITQKHDFANSKLAEKMEKVLNITLVAGDEFLLVQPEQTEEFPYVNILGKVESINGQSSVSTEDVEKQFENIEEKVEQEVENFETKAVEEKEFQVGDPGEINQDVQKFE